MEFLIGLLVGATIAGAIFFIVSKLRKPSGSFILDFSDPMKDICRLDLEESLDSIYKKKKIILRIKTVSQ